MKPVNSDRKKRKVDTDDDVIEAQGSAANTKKLGRRLEEYFASSDEEDDAITGTHDAASATRRTVVQTRRFDLVNLYEMKTKITLQSSSLFAVVQCVIGIPVTPHDKVETVGESLFFHVAAPLRKSSSLATNDVDKAILELEVLIDSYDFFELQKKIVGSFCSIVFGGDLTDVLGDGSCTFYAVAKESDLILDSDSGLLKLSKKDLDRFRVDIADAIVHDVQTKNFHIAPFLDSLQHVPVPEILQFVNSRVRTHSSVNWCGVEVCVAYSRKYRVPVIMISPNGPPKRDTMKFTAERLSPFEAFLYYHRFTVIDATDSKKAPYFFESYLLSSDMLDTIYARWFEQGAHMVMYNGSNHFMKVIKRPGDIVRPSAILINTLCFRAHQVRQDWETLQASNQALNPAF